MTRIRRSVVFAVTGWDQSATEVAAGAVIAVAGLGSILVEALEIRWFVVFAVAAGWGRSAVASPRSGPAEGLVEVLRTRRLVVCAVAWRERSAVPIPVVLDIRWLVVDSGIANREQSAVAREG